MEDEAGTGFLCDCCDEYTEQHSGYRGLSELGGISLSWHVCYACARKYAWLYLVDLKTGRVLIDSPEPVYWER